MQRIAEAPIPTAAQFREKGHQALVDALEKEAGPEASNEEEGSRNQQQKRTLVSSSRPCKMMMRWKKL